MAMPGAQREEEQPVLKHQVRQAPKALGEKYVLTEDAFLLP